MRYLVRPIQIIYSIYAIAVFVLFMFISLPFVVVAGIFPETTRGNLIYYIVTYWSGCVLFFWGMYHRNIYQFPHKADHPVIFVFNHISYVDIPILLIAFRHQHIRVLGKAEMAKIPIFGFMYRSAAIMVNRSSPEGRAESVNKLKAALNKNVSVVIAPEGTFNMTTKPLKEFYDGAFRIAIETRTPIKPVIFLDAYDRLHYNSVLTFTPGKSRAIFLEEVAVNGYALEDVKALKEKVYGIMEARLLENKATWITR